jgi:hypothetical protein
MEAAAAVVVGGGGGSSGVMSWQCLLTTLTAA